MKRLRRPDLPRDPASARDLRASEAALREAEERLRMLFEDGPIAEALVGLDHRFQAVNLRLCELLGHDEHELVGKTFEELTHPDDLERHLDPHRRLLAGEIRTYQIEKRYVHKLGHSIWAQLNVALVRCADGRPLHLVAQIQDITERIQTEAALREAEARFRNVFEEAPIGEAIVARDGRFLKVNRSLCEIVGYPEHELLEKTFQDITHPDDLDADLEFVRQMLAGEIRTYQMEKRYVHRLGHQVWVLLSVSLVRDQAGGPLYFVSQIQDITERKAADEERDRLRDELHHAQKLEALGRLAGGVAHDVNNMLTAIEGYSDLLLARLAPHTPLRAHAEQIRRAARQASALPRQLLAFSRRQASQATTVSLDDVVLDASDLLRTLVGVAAIEFVVAPGAGPAHVLADPAQLEQVLVNLAVNARDAMPDGGRLTIATRLVEVTAQTAEGEAAPGDYVVLSVRDTGEGMDAETRARIFEPFFTTKEDGGSGLGLATVYGVVAQSGGFVRVESEPGRGSLFEVHLPRVAAPFALPRRSGQEPGTLVPASGTVLLAEDEEVVRALAVTVLEEAGYRVVAAPSGGEALGLWRRHHGAIDVVVTDMVMPGLGGRVLAERILRERPATPFVLMSGYTEEAPLIETNGGPRPLFLQKPFAPGELLAAVASVVRRRVAAAV